MKVTHATVEVIVTNRQASAVVKARSPKSRAREPVSDLRQATVQVNGRLIQNSHMQGS